MELERGMHRRNLADGAEKFTHRCFEFCRRDGYHGLRDHFSVGVAGGSRNAETNRRLVAFIGIEHEARELGRFTEGDRQQPGGERIQRPGVARFHCAEQRAHSDQCCVGRYPGGLVQQQHAIDGAARGFQSG